MAEQKKEEGEFRRKTRVSKGREIERTENEILIDLKKYWEEMNQHIVVG